MALCVLSAFPSVLSCQCVDADCGSVSKSIQASVLQCHRVATQTKERDPFRKECCGKCQIEKTAVLSNKFFAANDVRPKNILMEMSPFASFYSKIRPPAFFRKRSSESPPGFFKRHVFGATLSFRGPPQG